MKRRLFLTGDMEIGKSTAIAAAVGDKMPVFGGYLTQRKLGEDGHAVSFSLVTPDGSHEAVFLDFSTGKPEIRLDVFGTLGVPALSKEILILDEIGGVELLDAKFSDALETVLRSDVPILGVLKGKSPSNALAEALNLTEQYQHRAKQLWEALSQDEDTLIYTCGKYDENALLLARQWVEEYVHA